MSIRRDLRNFISLNLSWVVLWISVVSPTANARSACDVVLSQVYAQRTQLAQPGMNAKSVGEQATAIVQALPKAFLNKYRDDIFTYLYKRSTRIDSLKILTVIYQAMIGKKTALDEATVTEKANSNKIDAKDEFNLRMHPNMHELQKLFEVADIKDDSNRSETDKRQIIDELKDKDPLEKQIVIRSVLQTIAETQPKNVSSFAYVILLEAATEMAKSDSAPNSGQDKRIVKQAVQLANDLGKLITPDSLDFNSTLAKEQLHGIVMQDVEGNRLQRHRAWLAFRNIFLKADMRPKVPTTLGSIAVGLVSGAFYVGKWFYSGDFDPASYYTFPNEVLGTWISMLGVKGILQYIWVINEGNHPLEYVKETSSGKTSTYYLKDETATRAKLLLAQLADKTSVIATILTRPVIAPPVSATPPAPTPAPVAAPAPTPPTPPAAPAVPVTSTPSASSAVAAPVIVPPKPKVVAPPAPVINVEELKQQLANTKTPEAFTPVVSDQIREAGKRFVAYFTEAKKRVVERDIFTDHVEIGLLMAKTANIQVLSEPGVGKTEVTKFIFNGIHDDSNKPSVFAIQMGKETTIDDLMGTIKPSEIQKDRIVRAVENGIPGKQFGFFDEYYRALMYTREALLEFMANGTVSLAGTTYESKTRLNVFASNSYPNQVFLRDGKAAKAEMDRMLFTHILPPIFENDENLIELENIDGTNMPEIHFSDIDLLREFAKKVPSDRYFNSKLKLLVNRMRGQVMKSEHESEIEWQKRIQAGEILLTSPEYNARVLSPRSESTAQKLLTRFATFDWINSGMPAGAPPVVTEKDFARLNEFFLANSSSDEHLQRVMREYAEGSAEYQQFKLIINSRIEYKKTLDEIEHAIAQDRSITELQRFVSQIGLSWEALNNSRALTPAHGEVFKDNAEAVKEFLKWQAALVKTVQNRAPIVEITPEDVAQDKALYLSNKILNYLKPART